MVQTESKTTPGTFALQQAERRQVTVLFCDLVGSTELSSKLDPEDLQSLMQRFQLACGSAAESHGGFIAQYLGDGMLIYFGYPVGQEDAACRALRAGLDILRVVPTQRAPSGAFLSVRVGAATGLAVIGNLLGSGAAAEIAVSGRVANLAARIIALAAPNTFLIAEETRRLTEQPFNFKALGEHKLRGIEGTVPVWRVLSENVERTRYEAKSKKASFVGRSQELKTLHALWDDATRGRGRVAFIRGEPGIGKTALMRRFESELQEQSFTRVLLQCSERHVDSALYPLIVHLRRAAGIEFADSAATKLRKIEALATPETLPQSTPLLASLLSVPTEGKYQSLPLPPSRTKALTHELIGKYTQALAQRHPVLLVVDDAHWIDPTSADLAERLVSELQHARVLFIIASRPKYEPAWEKAAQVCSINLRPLPEVEVRMLLAAMPEASALAPSAVAEIVARSEGIPLFAEELAKTVLEISRRASDASALHDGVIPETLQDSLLARLDRLGQSKQVAQIASVIGRKFTMPMLDKLRLSFAGDLDDEVKTLEASGLILARGDAMHREYTFSHALMQEAAYESLLRSRRREIHVLVAQSLEQHFAEIVDTEPESLAHHWTKGAQAARAIPYWLRAGQRSILSAANVEAIRHLRAGLDLLQQEPASRERDALDFHFHLGLGQAYYVVDGPGANLTAQAYTRAQALLDVIGEVEQRYTVLYGIFSSYHFASKFELALVPAKRVLELATRDGERVHMCQAHRMLGYIAFFTGDTTAASTHFGALGALYDPDEVGPLAARYGADCRIGAFGFLALVKCVSGDTSQAIELSRANLAYAKKLNHPASLGWAYASAAYLYYYLREPDLVLDITREGVRYCADNNIASWLAHCRAFHLWAAAAHHPSLEAAENLRSNISSAVTGNALGIPLLRTVLAEVLLLLRQPEQALLEVQSALVDIESTSQLFFEPNVHIVRAQCLELVNASGRTVAESYQAAIDSAQRMRMELLKTRAIDGLRAHVKRTKAA